MKRVLYLLFIVVLFISIIPQQVNSYSNNNYSINIPSDYKVINDSSGQHRGFEHNSSAFIRYDYDTAISVDIEVIKIPTEYRKNLKKITNDNKTIQDVKETILNQITSRGNSIISTSKGEYKTITKNSYKSIYLRIAYQTKETKIYSDFYIVFGQENMYLLIIESNSNSFLDSKEVKDIMKSFTINDYDSTVNHGIINIVGVIIDVIITVFLVVAFIAKYDKKQKENNLKEYMIGNNVNNIKEHNARNIIASTMYTIFYIAATFGTAILGSGIYFYTIYYYAVNNGFWAAFISFCTPLFSSVFLFFELLLKEGLWNNFTLAIIVLIAFYVLPIILRLFSNND